MKVAARRKMFIFFDVHVSNIIIIIIVIIIIIILLIVHISICIFRWSVLYGVFDPFTDRPYGNAFLLILTWNLCH